MKPVLIAFALLASLPLTAQEDEQPFFSVASSKVWTSSDRPSIQLSAWGVDSLEFRLYRIQDPVQFFRNLKDLHQFGGRQPRPAPKPTLLERIHDWKNGWRYEYRSLIREQFDNESHARISRFLDTRRESQAARRITNFTPLPLLNEQQLVSKWKQRMPKRGGWYYEAVRFDNPGKGVYLMEAADKELRAYTLVMVSDVTVISKTAPGTMLAFVADRASGAPLANADISIIAKGQPAGHMTSGTDGLATIPLVLAQPENVVILAHRGMDWAIESPYGFNFGEREANAWHGIVYTDRPVYRPTHPVNFKAVIRTERGLDYTIPEGNVDLLVNDPDGKTVFEKKNTPISPMGTVAAQFTLRPDATIGYYSIIARSPNQVQTNGGFQVEEYKKPEYEVRVIVDKPRTFEGDPIRATIDARYFFGEPVANAKVTWVAYRSPYYSPVFYRDENPYENSDGPPAQDADFDQGGDQTEEHTGKLDGEGRLNISVPTTAGKTDFSYRIEARVTDEGNREITGHSFAIATRGNFVVNVQPDRYVYTPGQQASFRIEARDYDGKPVATMMRLDLQTWNGDDTKQRTVVGSASGSTDATSGTGAISITIPKAGSLIARVIARTPVGRDVDDEAYIWVTSGGGALEGFPNGQDIQILPDQKTYKPGDTAKVLVISQSRMDHVLVTVEGRGIDSPQVLHPGAKSFTVDIPIKSDYVPNFFLNVSTLIAGELHSGSKSISVPAAEKELKIEVEPGKPQYKPGESAVYSVRAHDAAGNPVVANLSLGVVDKAIYSIQPDMTLNLKDVFYGWHYNSVNTEDSLAYFFSGAAGTRRMQLTKLRPATALGALKPERLVQPKVRKAFPDTALWLADLMTDSSGNATARFDFPDSLTTWRATARAVTRDTKVGVTTQDTIVRKNLMLRLATPRFLTQGDEVVISAIVHNYLQDAKTARVSLDLDGLDVLNGAQQDVTIPSRGDAKVDWRVRPRDVPSVKITGKALTDEESDAMEISLPINPRGVKLSVARTGVLTDAATSFNLSVPSSAASFGSKLNISATPSIAGSLFGALDYLTTFPYGCTEQIMSSFLPNLVVSDALAKLHVKTGADPAELNAKVGAGMQRLYEFQHPDGGWGWWPTDESSVFMTAYAVAGLNQASDLGHPAKRNVVPRATKWLQQALAKDTKIDPDLRAYAIYASRGDVEPGWNGRAALSPYGLAFVGLALDAKKDSRALDAATEIESKAKQDNDTAHWDLDRDSLMGFYGDTSPEATAFALKLLVRQKPSSPLIPKAVRWLIAHRNEGAWWYSTKQTAMVIYGLTDYLQHTGELNADFTAAISANGQGVLSKRFTAADALAAVPEQANLPAPAGSQSIQITRNGDGRLYWSAREDFYSTDKKLVDNGAVKLNIVREYFRLIPGKKDDRIVYDLQPLNGPLQNGDLLGVRLTVSGSDWRYLLAEDPIPSGAEFVSRDDLYELRDPKRWWNTFYSRREFHDDRAAFFNNYFPAGQIQQFYLLKITNAGRFHVNPARVYPMYQPERLATTGSAEIVVQ